MIFCGIDPGLKGGIAFLESSLNRLTTYPMPLREDGIDAYKIVVLLHNWKPAKLTIEDQFASKFGKMGVRSLLVMGQNWGKIVGAAQALKIETEIVLPNVWQAKMCPKKLFPFKDSKERAHAAAKMFAPAGHSFIPEGSRTFHDGMTDAALLAYYGFHSQGPSQLPRDGDSKTFG